MRERLAPKAFSAGPVRAAFVIIPCVPAAHVAGVDFSHENDVAFKPFGMGTEIAGSGLEIRLVSPDIVDSEDRKCSNSRPRIFPKAPQPRILQSSFARLGGMTSARLRACELVGQIGAPPIVFNASVRTVTWATALVRARIRGRSCDERFVPVCSWY